MGNCRTSGQRLAALQPAITNNALKCRKRLGLVQDMTWSRPEDLSSSNQYGLAAIGGDAGYKGGRAQRIWVTETSGTLSQKAPLVRGQYEWRESKM